MSNFSVFEEIGKVDSRNEMTSILADFFSGLDSTNAQIYSYLLQGRVAPLFVDKEFSFSEKSAMKVLEDIVRISGLNVDVKKMRVELGDAGLVAEKIIESKSGASNGDIVYIYDALWKIINATGVNSMKTKSDIFADLISHSSSVDAKFLTRIVSGKLRLGCSDKTLLDALSFILVGDKSVRGVLDNAYGVVSDLGFIADIVCSDKDVESRLSKLEEIEPVLGIPIFPRLVERVDTFKAVMERFPDGGIIQPKFDGLRCQIHKGVKKHDLYKTRIWSKYLDEEGQDLGLFGNAEHTDVKLFSRNLNDITEMFPDIVKLVANLNIDSCIIDGEIIGWDEKKEVFIPFQETMTRKRKYDVQEHMSTVPVKYFAFDLMYLDGKNLINYDLENRLSSLDFIDNGENTPITKADSLGLPPDVKGLEGVFRKYIDERLEGLIVKKRHGGYMPGRRNFDWIKVKKSMESNVVDTIDTVVLGYYYGSGKKTAFGMGSLLVGVYNSDEDKFESVGKVGTGITDATWGTISTRLESLVLKDQPKNVYVDMVPDVWVNPEVVVTVEADEISKSSVHTACRSILGHGLSLRFPRLLVFDRDKLPEDATSVSELAEMWKMSR